ncbi:MAG: VOC family protein [Lentisphaeria bacterium]|nr:VOC family protein [Lentisphaeria bacterium]
MEHAIITGIDHPAVAAVDPARLAQWYIAVLGYAEYHRTDRNVWILAAPDGSLLEVMPKDDTARPARTTWTPGWSHLALRVNDLDQAAALLRDSGVVFPDAPVPAIGGGQLLNFVDPEGNMLQIVSRS